MILYGSSMSPFVRKVIAFAAEKGIELDVQPVGIGDASPEFRQASPFGKMPGSPTATIASPIRARSSIISKPGTRSRS